MRFLRMAMAAGATLLLGGCLSTLPTREEASRVPEEVADIYRRSGDEYLQSAQVLLARGAQIAADSPSAATSAILEGWNLCGEAWDRFVLAADLQRLTDLAMAVLQAPPTEPEAAVAKGLDTFSSMMGRFRARYPRPEDRPPALEDFYRRLDEYSSQPIDSYDRLRRAWAAQLELWKTDSPRRGDAPLTLDRSSERYGRLLGLLRLAETSTLRGKVPLAWSRGAQRALLPPPR